MNRQALRDFLITLLLLGVAMVFAFLSSVAAHQYEAYLATALAGSSLVLAVIGGIYIIPRLARRIRVEFLRFAIRTSVTVEGVIFVVSLAIIALSAWNTANNLLYLVFAVMVAFLIVANLIARLSVANLSVQLRFPENIYAGDPVDLSVTVTNHKRVIPSFSILVDAITGDGPVDDGESEEKPRTKGGMIRDSLDKLAHFILIPPGNAARHRVRHTFERRGRYPISSFRISSKFPTGFFKKWRIIEATGEILVYPKPVPLDDFYHALPMLAGQVSSLVRGSGDDLYSIRRYQPSDHMRHIDWKATAKQMSLMVREHTREDERRLTIVFDTSRFETSGSDTGRDSSAVFQDRFEKAVTFAASLANHFIQERADVELVARNESLNVEAATGTDQLHRILRSLAMLDPDAPQAGEPAPARRRWWNRKQAPAQAASVPAPTPDAFRFINEAPVLSDSRRFKVLITSAPKGTIPANIWRSSHVVFMQDLIEEQA